MGPYGIMFHFFWGKAGHPKVQGAITSDELRRILLSVGLERIVSPDEWRKRTLENSLTGTEVCLTFDDCLLSQFDVAKEVLDDLQLKAFWFIYSSVFEGHVERLEIYRRFASLYFDDVEEFNKSVLTEIEKRLPEAFNKGKAHYEVVGFRPECRFYSESDRLYRFLRDNYLTREEYTEILDGMITDMGLTLEGLAGAVWMKNDHLRQLSSEGHELGLHSYNHPTTIGKFPRQRQFDEYKRNLDHLVRITGKKPWSVAHPANSYNTDTLDILREMGVEVGFRSIMTGGAGSQLEMARQNHCHIMEDLGMREFGKTSDA